MKAVIPTGGRGTRMQPLTFSTNKHFIPIANKPLIYYPIEAIADAGIREVAVTYNPGGLELAQFFLGDGSRWGLKFTYVLQEKPLGLANIFEVCEEFLRGDPFLMHLGDNIFTEGIKPYVEYFEKNKPNGLLTMIKHPENVRLGVPVFDKKGRLIDYLEKPQKPPNKFGVPGLYFFDKNVFRCFKGKDRIKPSARGEYEIRSPFMWLVEHGYRVDTLEYKARWLDPGKFDDWIEANQYLLDQNVESGILSKLDKSVVIKGRVQIDKGCTIKNSEIRGPVSIARGVTIIDSYIGPFTAIAKDCIIESTKIENSVLMSGVRITKVGQTIDNSLIGPGSEIQGGTGGYLGFFIGEKALVRL